jgi:hypothetical protein
MDERGERNIRPAHVDLRDFVSAYRSGELVRCTCARCGWKIERDNNLSEIDARTKAWADFLDHTCTGANSAVMPDEKSES